MARRKPKRRGRPGWKPKKADLERVRTLAGMGMVQRDIARVMRVSVPTLRKHCGELLRVAALEANASVALALFKSATGTGGFKVNAISQIFWLKTRAQWIEFEKLLRGEDAKGKKEQRADKAAEVAASGRFKPSAPPRLAVVGGTAAAKPKPAPDPEPDPTPPAKPAEE